ncbi:MAG: MBOAT family protein [Oscillospiraceae bacterium]|nr:MBOAT family protein [Oscillospiraceae bacterium]
MVFSSILFLFLFLPLVLFIYYITPRKCRNLFLFIVSLIFYCWGEPTYIFIMLFSTISDYIHGILIDKFRKNKTVAKALMISAVVINLVTLCYFKYSNFLLSIFKCIPAFSSISLPQIALPLGISFYTFQTMSYSIDVYRGDAPVQKNIISFGAFVVLFPQLIAGPIVRYQDIAYQLDHRKETLAEFTKGIKLFLIGLSKKVLLANQMGILWDTLRSTTEKNGILGCWIGIIAYSMQIYFDFSGYSDMACGLGNMLGFEFLKNFNYPYISKSLTEFWRRWHISLGTLFKEYVYIPLGGNRKGPKRQLFNLMIVWFLTGLWHGANWNYVMWGVYYGIILIAEKLFLIKFLEKLPAVLRHIYSLFFAVTGFVIFFFEDTHKLVLYLKSLFFFDNGLISVNALNIFLANLPLIGISAIACTPVMSKLYYKVKSHRLYWIAESSILTILMLLCTASLVSQSYNPFLYFRF